MRAFLFYAVLFSLSLQAHQHHHADKAVTCASVLWNGVEVGNHIHALATGGTCCGHASKAYHVVEALGHTTNLVDSGLHFLEEKSLPILLPLASLSFNVWAACAQFNRFKELGTGAVAIFFKFVTAVDIWGHAVSAYAPIRELTAAAICALDGSCLDEKSHSSVPEISAEP